MNITSLGYFDAPGQTTPAYEPPRDTTPCCVCGEPLATRKVLCRSLMLLGAHRSYFMLFHADCKEREPEVVDQAEADAVAEIERREQLQ